MKTHTTNKTTKVLVHAGLVLFTIYLVFPLLWMISTSLKSTTEIYSGIISLIPEQITVEHYLAVLGEGAIPISMLNSLYAGLLSTVVVVIIALPASYAMTRYQSVLNKFFLGWILTTQIFPVILIMVPLYIILRHAGLTDSLNGLALVYVVWSLPFVLWMLHGYMKGIPIELEEAAIMDGANRTQIIYRVLAPVLLPAIGAAMLFSFIGAWNEFFFAFVLMKSPDSMTLPVELARFTGLEGQARTGPLAAASFLATIPSFVLFAFMQRWFSSGLLGGMIK